MSRHDTRAVLFDLGGVLVELKYEQALEEFLRHTPRPRAAVETLLTTDAQTIEFEEGRLSGRAYFAHVQRALEFRGDYAAFLRIWNGWIGEHSPVAQLLAALTPRYRIGILSNTNALHLRHVLETFSFVRHIDRCIASCWVGCSKPSPRIYEIAIARLSVPAESIVYIDDRQEFVAQGRQLGLQALQFTDHDTLTTALQEQGITWTDAPRPQTVSR